MAGPHSRASVLNPRMGLKDGAGGADRAAFGLQTGGHGRAGRVAGRAAHLFYRVKCERQRLGPMSIDAKASLKEAQ